MNSFIRKKVNPCYRAKVGSEYSLSIVGAPDVGVDPVVYGGVAVQGNDEPAGGLLVALLSSLRSRMGLANCT